MAIAFRSKTYSGIPLTGTGFTATESAGASENDILLMWFGNNDGNALTTPPSGWTLIYANNSTSQSLSCWLYYIRRGASAPSYTVAWTNSVYYEWSVTAWVGVITTGNPINTSATTGILQNRDPANPDCPSITTTVTNTMVLAVAGTWANLTSGFTPPSGYDLREGIISGALCLASKNVAVAGVEDPGAYSGAPAGSSNVDEITVALIPNPYYQLVLMPQILM